MNEYPSPDINLNVLQQPWKNLNKYTIVPSPFIGKSLDININTQEGDVSTLDNRVQEIVTNRVYPTPPARQDILPPLPI